MSLIFLAISLISFSTFLMLVEYGPSPCNSIQQTKISKYQQFIPLNHTRRPKSGKSTMPSQTIEEIKTLNQSRARTTTNTTTKPHPQDQITKEP